MTVEEEQKHFPCRSFPKDAENAEPEPSVKPVAKSSKPVGWSVSPAMSAKLEKEIRQLRSLLCAPLDKYDNQAFQSFLDSSPKIAGATRAALVPKEFWPRPISHRQQSQKQDTGGNILQEPDWPSSAFSFGHEPKKHLQQDKGDSTNPETEEQVLEPQRQSSKIPVPTVTLPLDYLWELESSLSHFVTQARTRHEETTVCSTCCCCGIR